MSGTGHSVTTVSRTFNQNVDGLLTTIGWGDAALYYSFPTSSSEYGYSGERASFSAVSATQRIAAQFALDTAYGTAADDGFSLEGFTNLTVVLSTAANAHLRLSNSSLPSTAWAYGPTTNQVGGDVWFGGSGRNPIVGTYDWATTLHEIGHALGLKHAHETDNFGATPLLFDQLQYTVMSYRSYYNQTIAGGYSNATYSFPQTYMMLDIAALQSMYGADFTTNGGNTTYTWAPGSGSTFVDSGVGVQAVGNTIFATIWDGGGVDTYNLAAYTTSLYINLVPGEASIFSGTQLAYLGDGNYAAGNIFNALLFQGDSRSLIENAYGGSADDSIVGNSADNLLVGFGGNDIFYGDAGNDMFSGGLGADQMTGGAGFDYAAYFHATSTVVVWLDGTMGTNYGEAAGDVLSGMEGLIGSYYLDYLIGDALANAVFGLGGTDYIFGLGGHDVLYGQDGIDRLSGNAGNDVLVGGEGIDYFVFEVGALDGVNNVDYIGDFVAGVEKIYIDDAIMAALGAPGALAASAFLSSASGLATLASHRIVYNSSTGDLYYDADGVGAGGAVKFATLLPSLALTAADFFVF